MDMNDIDILVTKLFLLLGMERPIWTNWRFKKFIKECRKNGGSKIIVDVEVSTKIKLVRLRKGGRKKIRMAVLTPQFKQEESQCIFRDIPLALRYKERDWPINKEEKPLFMPEQLYEILHWSQIKNKIKKLKEEGFEIIPEGFLAEIRERFYPLNEPLKPPY